MDDIQKINDENLHRPSSESTAPSLPALKLPWLNVSPVLFAFIGLAIVFLLYQVVGGVISYILFGANVTDDNVNLMRTISVIGQFLFMLIPSVLLARSQRWDLRKIFRIRMPGVWEVVLVILAVAGLQIALQVYLISQDYILETFLMPTTLKPLIDQIKKMINELYTKLVFAHTPLELFYIIIVIGLTPAICEEALFRGLVQGAFEKGMKAAKSIVFCGIIFALFHLNPFAFVPLAILGIYFSFIVWKGNSIVLAAIAHFMNNSLAAISLYFLGTDAVIIPSQSGTDLSTPVLAANFIVGISVFSLATFFFWKAVEKRKERAAALQRNPEERDTTHGVF